MRPVNTLDFETDPFEYRVDVKPFVAGFYDGKDFASFWSVDCVSQYLEMMDRREPSYVYAHNGGKFDFLLGLLEHAHGPVRIINGRVVEMKIGQHIYRDSYSIIPIPLKAYDKDDIDYMKLHRTVREQHRAEILKYLRKDCVSLHQLVVPFLEEFGNRLTIAGAAMKQLSNHHDYEKGNVEFDKRFRKSYYFGGRVQCFKTGIVKQPIKIYDLNSSYPFSMKNFLHPVGVNCHYSDRIEDDTCFITAEGRNMGAFAQRAPDGSLTFEGNTGIYSTTIHEWNAALDTGTFEPQRIIETVGFENRITFAEFVDHFFNARLTAKRMDDRIHDIFYKLVLNSSYGRFAINPENFCEYRIEPIGVNLADRCPVCKGTAPHDCEWCEGYGTAWIRGHIKGGKYVIWRQPTLRKNYCNIATGASITGASRALLLRGLAGAINPIYCDTDSIMCEELQNVPFHDSELGAWKSEGSGEMAAIGGKKLYAVFTRNKPSKKDIEKEPWKGKPIYLAGQPVNYCIKKAHKGARLEPKAIVRIARGKVIETFSPVPAFKLDGTTRWTKRRLRRTAFTV